MQFTQPLRSGITAYTTMTTFPKCYFPVIITIDVHTLKNNVRLKSEAACIQVSMLNTSGKLFVTLRESSPLNILTQLACYLEGIAEKKELVS